MLLEVEFVTWDEIFLVNNFTLEKLEIKLKWPEFS